MYTPSKHCFSKVFAIGIALLLGLQSAWAQVKVACVGDSITAGYALQNPGADSYPSQLQVLLGNGYTVGNFGLSGATVLKRSDYSYWNTGTYRSSLRFKPDIVVIMLGTNDSKPWNWDATKFAADYSALIAKYEGLSSHPKVYICLAPPVYDPNPFGSAFDPVFVQNTLIPAIEDIAISNRVTLIDNNTHLLNQPELFNDGVHPSVEGAGVIAQTVANAL